MQLVLLIIYLFTDEETDSGQLKRQVQGHATGKCVGASLRTQLHLIQTLCYIVSTYPSDFPPPCPCGEGIK